MTLQQYAEAVYFPQYQDEKEPVHLKGGTSVSTRNRFSRASVDPDSPRVRHSTH